MTPHAYTAIGSNCDNSGNVAARIECARAASRTKRVKTHWNASHAVARPGVQSPGKSAAVCAHNDRSTGDTGAGIN
jgi:hypothetical protein